MATVPNPLKLLILELGAILSRAGLVDLDRIRRTVDLAWPRIVTGLSRMSKSAIDIAMVGTAIGPAAIAGVGFAGPYWGFTFTIGGGLATGTIALVSQRYSANALDQLGQAVRSSALLVLIVSLPITIVFWLFSTELISLLTDNPRSIELGAAYLRVLAFGVPFGALNLVGGRVLIGADDAWSPMVLRAGGAVINIGLNAVLIFGLGMGVVGAALGTVLSNVVVTTVFAIGLVGGRLPGIGRLPVTTSVRGSYVHPRTLRDLITISLPATARRGAWTAARFPLLALVALFGPAVTTAYVVSRRIWGLLNTPGWGFGLAASSLVGQSLGEGDEKTAEAYGHEIALVSVATYLTGAVIVGVFAEPIVRLFLDSTAAETISIAVGLVYVVCLSVIARGIGGTYAGALDAAGDTRWPFYSRVLGMFGLAIPLTYLGTVTSLGIYGLYLGYFGQTLAPALVNYYRFTTGKWKVISRGYRPESADISD